MSRTIASTCDPRVRGGRRIVGWNQAGRSPMTATSLAFTRTAYHHPRDAGSEPGRGSGRSHRMAGDVQAHPSADRSQRPARPDAGGRGSADEADPLTRHAYCTSSTAYAILQLRAGQFLSPTGGDLPAQARAGRAAPRRPRPARWDGSHHRGASQGDRRGRGAAAAEPDRHGIAPHRVAPGRPDRGCGTTSYKVGILCRCPVLLVK